MKIKCRLVEAEQIISEMEERLIDVADDIAETEEDTQLIVSGWWVFLPQLNLQLHEGILFPCQLVNWFPSFLYRFALLPTFTYET